MQFNSFIFILLFLPLTVTAYYLSNKINSVVGKLVLLVSSVLFYAYTDWTTLIILGISLVINYGFSVVAMKSKKRRSLRLYLCVTVIVNVGLLLYFKYLNFTISNINTIFAYDIPLKELILPIGISFFTFQQIAYIVAIYKGELENNNVLDYLVYILYFPKILMGPLADPVDFIDQLNDSSIKKFNWDNLAYGIKIFSLGLFKKAMLADVFANAVTWGYTNIDAATAMDWALVMLFYTFEIYFDFSGYSDMAVGASLMLNISLPINFDSPYKAISIRDFWKRWHISLTKFFTKYIYIPLGGSKKGTIFTYINTMIVFLVSGIWHGANWTFVLWGVLHGAFCVCDRIFEKFQKKICEPARWICTFIVVNVLWLLFRSDSIQQWWEILTKIICFQDMNISDGTINVFTLQEASFIRNILGLEWFVENIRGFWMLIYIIASYSICLLFENNYRKLKENSWFMMVISAIAFLWGFICLSGESVFVYFNF